MAKVVITIEDAAGGGIGVGVDFDADTEEQTIINITNATQAQVLGKTVSDFMHSFLRISSMDTSNPEDANNLRRAAVALLVNPKAMDVIGMIGDERKEQNGMVQTGQPPTEEEVGKVLELLNKASKEGDS